MRLKASSPCPANPWPDAPPAQRAKFAKLGIHGPVDLLLHLPLRYEDRTRFHAFDELQVGQMALVRGRILDVRTGRRRLEVRLGDDDGGELTLRLFHFRAPQAAAFEVGHWVRCYGTVRGSTVGPEMIHPEYRITPEPPPPESDDTLTPVYPTTQGLTQYQLRRRVDQTLTRHLPMPELLPDALVPDLPTFNEAIRQLHRPKTNELPVLPLAERRLALEELLAQHLTLSRLRAAREAQQAPQCPPGPSWDRLQASLPFSATAAQTRVIGELSDALARPVPMLRLVHGDVGCGKTLVAAAAALQVIDQGWQVALMAPTELLAEQHQRVFNNWFSPLGFPPVCLTGSRTAAGRREAMKAIAAGDTRLVIGTHALFQRHVAFAKLGLIVIDEQHRFGVDQRLALRDKGGAENLAPHQLIMSATPIPRSMAMLLYADLELSRIDELPPGRQPVTTAVAADTKRDEVAARLLKHCRAGRQAYWVCPLIEDSEKLPVRAATAAHEWLSERLPDLRIGLVHGRLKAADKLAVMHQFGEGELDVLVATSVIEVGVDVPNAGMMIIESAERLGLAQLHQLRGRVGRGAQAASCMLLYTPPLGAFARKRLAALRATHDGFDLAEQDLQLRGPGELLGRRQAGVHTLRVADLHRDRGLFPQLENLATKLNQQHPELVAPLIERWLGGEASRFLLA